MVARTQIGPDTPAWARQSALQTDRAAGNRTKRPVAFPIVANTAALPTASKWTGCGVFNTALGQLCLSDGAFWYPVTMGSHL